VTPPTSQTTVGANFNVVIQIQAGAQSVDGGSVSLDFDPSILQVVKVTSGTALPVPIQNTFNNVLGTVDYSAGIFSGFPSGTFTLATVTFTSLATSAGTSLSFHDVAPRQSDVTFGGSSVLTAVQSATVIISAANAPTDTPVEAPTDTPTD